MQLQNVVILENLINYGAKEVFTYRHLKRMFWILFF